MKTSTITVAQSNAFVSTFDLSPTDGGTLDGLRFAVKDTIDIAGFKTGCGNPTWRESHPRAVVHAVCVEQLLRAGARCVGKTICVQAPAVLAKPFATSWRSVFWVRITFTGLL